LVELALLEAELLAVALWDLRAQGHVDISGEPEQRGLFQGPGHGFGYRDPFWLRFTPCQTPSKTAGLERELLSALGDSPADLDELVNDRWLSGKTLAVNGVVVCAQREALTRGLLYRLPNEGPLPKSLAWSKSLPCYVGDAAALARFEVAAVHLAQEVIRLDKSADWGWKTLVREAKRALSTSRPYFHFEGGGS
jgi:hypothetical protein